MRRLKVRPDIRRTSPLSVVPPLQLLNVTQRDRKGEDHDIHLLWLHNPSERFWPVPRLTGALNSDKGSLTWGGDSAQGPCPPRHKSWMYSIWLRSQPSPADLRPVRPRSPSPSPSIFLLLSSYSRSLGFNCFEAERSPQGAQQDVLQSFGETGY